MRKKGTASKRMKIYGMSDFNSREVDIISGIKEHNIDFSIPDNFNVEECQKHLFDGLPKAMDILKQYFTNKFKNI